MQSIPRSYMEEDNIFVPKLRVLRGLSLLLDTFQYPVVMNSLVVDFRLMFYVL